MLSPIRRGFISHLKQLISNGGLKPKLDYALYEPGPGFSRRAFRNARVHAETHGGRVRFGWVFQVHYGKTETSALPYLAMRHHVVWQSIEGGCLVDVTPFEETLKPLMTQDGWILFLIDETAVPKTALELALPTRFYALQDEKRLHPSLQALNEAEQLACERAYQKATGGLIQLEC